MAPRGSRYFGGRLYDFWARHVGPEASTDARTQARILRADGYFVRLVKVERVCPDWCVYRLKNEGSKS